MAITFTGPDAFKFFGFTPQATAVLQATPSLLVILLLVLLGMTALGLVAWYIHFVTNKVYYKPKPKKDAKGAPPAKKG
ncbi:hypothetical protein LSUE1_G006402 [Lachnellula suecica]|uniref:Uncharacterized protein n=1 Tax=Lachnellula suecica TaxID=602035 RepID=A0A8T9BZ18_9HELO|nr:hypothetical protein LSUE1_G006402 [Lachnellula suecica]